MGSSTKLQEKAPVASLKACSGLHSTSQTTRQRRGRARQSEPETIPPYGGSEKATTQDNFPTALRSSETADLFLALILYRLKKDGRAAVIIPDGFLFGQDSAKVEIKRRLLEDFNLHTVVRMPQSVFAPYASITTNILFFDNTGKSDGVWFYRMDMPEGYKHFSKTKPMRGEHFDHVREWWVNRKEIELPDGPKARRYTVEELVAGGFNFDLCGYPHEEEVILPPDELIATTVPSARSSMPR